MCSQGIVHQSNLSPSWLYHPESRPRKDAQQPNGLFVVSGRTIRIAAAEWVHESIGGARAGDADRRTSKAIVACTSEGKLVQALMISTKAPGMSQ